MLLVPLLVFSIGFYELQLQQVESAKLDCFYDVMCSAIVEKKANALKAAIETKSIEYNGYLELISPNCLRNNYVKALFRKNGFENGMTIITSDLSPILHLFGLIKMASISASNFYGTYKLYMTEFYEKYVTLELFTTFAKNQYLWHEELIEWYIKTLGLFNGRKVVWEEIISLLNEKIGFFLITRNIALNVYSDYYIYQYINSLHAKHQIESSHISNPKKQRHKGRNAQNELDMSTDQTNELKTQSLLAKTIKYVNSNAITAINAFKEPFKLKVLVFRWLTKNPTLNSLALKRNDYFKEQDTTSIQALMLDDSFDLDHFFNSNKLLQKVDEISRLKGAERLFILSLDYRVASLYLKYSFSVFINTIVYYIQKYFNLLHQYASNFVYLYKKGLTPLQRLVNKHFIVKNIVVEESKAYTSFLHQESQHLKIYKQNPYAFYFEIVVLFEQLVNPFMGEYKNVMDMEAIMDDIVLKLMEINK